MKHLKNSLVVFAAVFVIGGVVTLFVPSLTKGQKSADVPKTAFSVFTDNGKVSGPDPAGTSYAITSLTVADVGFGSAAVIVRGVWGDTSDCISISNSSVALGPLVKVPAGETVHLSFPQPFILSAKPGATSCLRVEGPAGIDYTVVGYKF